MAERSGPEVQALASVVMRRRGADPEVVEGVTRELDRLDRIVRGLLDYARPGDEALTPLDPGAVILKWTCRVRPG